MPGDTLTVAQVERWEGAEERFEREPPHLGRGGPEVVGTEAVAVRLDGRAQPDEHTLVAVTALGRALRPDETVHHRNEDKTDNRWSNLDVLTRSEHGRHHYEERGVDDLGRFAPEVSDAGR